MTVPGRRAVAFGVAVAVAAVLTGCGSAERSSAKAAAEPELRVTGAYMPAPVTDAMAAGFFVVRNSGGADTLLSVRSDLANQVTMHSTKDGVMQEQKTFSVPAGGTLNFESGGSHLMFEKLTHKPKQGEKVTVELRFRKAGRIDVQLPVKPPTYNPKSGR
ncbi:copper chaperone PCu(A)C [Streptomyces cavernae]|uniref:copper chaperone PCu(A)C n=1 Tax=Streptomyces cavernae TaxID=2259034 RepID=UPI001EE4904B|nr:copper chaperone PCu(A)C [Streptomyces cavernae]